jgi:hypothetical protein
VKGKVMKKTVEGSQIDSYLEVVSMLEDSDSSVLQTASLLNEGDAEVEVME